MFRCGRSRLIHVVAPSCSTGTERLLHGVVDVDVDVDVLSRLEQQVLERLDPPLHLRGRPPTPLRTSLSSFRRAWS